MSLYGAMPVGECEVCFLGKTGYGKRRPSLPNDESQMMLHELLLLPHSKARRTLVYDLTILRRKT
jgi:hypothetical protein